MENVVSIKNLSISYFIREGEVKSVQDVSIDFPKGKNVAVIGESGCGKSTIANSILGILASNSKVLNNSQIIFQGKNILKASKEEKEFSLEKSFYGFSGSPECFKPHN